MIVCDALLTTADIREQTKSQGYQRSQLQLGQNGGIWTAEHISSSFWLQQLALASLVASEMYEAAKVSTQVKSQTRH